MKMMNNKVVVKGTVKSEARYSHEVMGEKFYEVLVGVKRASGAEDTLPVLVSERCWDVNTDYSGKRVTVEGNYRSQNMDLDGRHRLILNVFAKNICVEPDEEFVFDKNQIELNGYICKQPVYRTTPLGREVCDVLLAVNRDFGKSDYIPCLFWGRNARYMADKQVGEQFKVTGRIQSREYVKVLGDVTETRIAYEVSVAALEPVTEEVFEQQDCQELSA